MRVGLRCYLDVKRQYREKTPEFSSGALVMSLDTETTADAYQNLKFGSCGIWEGPLTRDFIIFYEPKHCKNEEIAVLKAQEQYMPTRVMTVDDFLKNVFIPTMYEVGRAEYTGFNVPFDHSRLAIRYTKSTMAKGGFSFVFSEDRQVPRITVKTIDSKRAFINFTKASTGQERGTQNTKEKRTASRGFFVDQRTFLFALTSKKFSLKRALKAFKCQTKKGEPAEHGKITPEYVEYNISDTIGVHELYMKTIDRYSIYGLERGANRLYSPASIGKAYIAKIGIKPFFEKNPDFPKDIMGHVMTTFYGARTEVRVRKKPVKVAYIDFTSMYPTMYVLFCMDKYLKAARIRYDYTTRETQELLDKITLADITNKDTWKYLVTICKIKPDNDVLPVRALLGKTAYTNSVSSVTSDTSLWYTLPDIIASKFLSGKTPVIEEAITFTPEGMQPGLRDIEVLKDMPCRLEEDFIKKLMEERIRVKRVMKKLEKDGKKNSDEWNELNLKQNILKIIANATSYGIYIEVNSNEAKGDNVTMYGLDAIEYPLTKVETEGEAFNPIIATFLTAGSRLILAATEAKLAEFGGQLVYCDTDSAFVTPKFRQDIQAFFQPLNPYDEKAEMFKLEDDKVEEDNTEEDPDDTIDDYVNEEQEKNGRPLDDVWFYGISSKRYVLYDYDEATQEPLIRRYSAHGLGHLMFRGEKKYWLKKIWRDILTMHYSPGKTDDILDDYRSMYAIMKMAVTKYPILERFRVFNEGKPLDKQIKPYNFFLVGTGYQDRPGTDEKIYPMIPYVDPKSDAFDYVPYDSFVDFKTGDYYSNTEHTDTQLYWKPLSVVLKEYINHPELKMDGETDLHRLHITIEKKNIRYLGKESNDLEEYMKLGVPRDAVQTFMNLGELILTIKPKKEAAKVGLPERTIYEHQKMIRRLESNGKKFDPRILKRRAIEAYINYFS